MALGEILYGESKTGLGVEKFVADGVVRARAMQRLLSKQEFNFFLRYLQLICKQRGLTVFLTSAGGIIEAKKVTEISTVADNIIILRYFEVKDTMGREIVILKTRGSAHEKKEVRFEITGSGMNVQT